MVSPTNTSTANNRKLKSMTTHTAQSTAEIAIATHSRIPKIMKISWFFTELEKLEKGMVGFFWDTCINAFVREL